MAGQTKLTLDLNDVYGIRIKDKVDLFLKHTVLSHAPILKNMDASKRITITGLDFTQGGRYTLLIYPTKYRPVSRIVRVFEDQTTSESFFLPVDPAKVIGIDAPDFDALPEISKTILGASDIESYPGKRGAELYQAFDDIRKAGFLNITAKMLHTTFHNEHSSLSYLDSLTRLRGDRFFANVKKELRDEVINSISSNLFHKADESLHTPPPNFIHAGSYKTPEPAGNLQLTFFSNPATLAFMIDTDIDDAQGLKHIFQVLSHIGGGETNPYDIHEILIRSQKLDPGYILII